MLEAAWIGVNLLVGIPFAVVFVVTCRELVRIVLAVAFGFRGLELKWGVGRLIWAKSLGPVDVVFRRLPLGASIVAESGSPRNHRIARLALSGGPILVQIGFFFWTGATRPTLSNEVVSGFAPLAVLHLSNICLVGLHSLIPFETRSGFRTDVRSILDIAFGRAEANRHARASYYARYARHWLERADVERAEAILDQGLKQLGREPLLVACEAQMLAEDLRSVVDQGACADAFRVLIEDAEPERRKDRESQFRSDRFRQAMLSALPMSLAALGLMALESEQLSRFVHQRLIVASDVAASSRIPSDCKKQLTLWTRWMPALDLLLPDDPGLQGDRYEQMARLEQCRGQLDAAVVYQTRAIAAAEQVRALSVQSSDSDPDSWGINAGRLAILLRHAAELESDRGQHRLALVALGRAEAELGLAQNRLRARTHSDRRTRTDELLEVEKVRLQSARSQILARMSGQ
jgi:hypothetical protein